MLAAIAFPQNAHFARNHIADGFPSHSPRFQIRLGFSGFCSTFGLPLQEFFSFLLSTDLLLPVSSNSPHSWIASVSTIVCAFLMHHHSWKVEKCPLPFLGGSFRKASNINPLGLYLVGSILASTWNLMTYVNWFVSVQCFLELLVVSPHEEDVYKALFHCSSQCWLLAWCNGFVRIGFRFVSQIIKACRFDFSHDNFMIKWSTTQYFDSHEREWVYLG